MTRTGSIRGFAAMDSQRQREIASRGGRSAHERGVAHEFDSREAREAGRRGGEAVSRNREHMARIGARGGQRSHDKRRQREDGPVDDHSSRSAEDDQARLAVEETQPSIVRLDGTGPA